MTLLLYVRQAVQGLKITGHRRRDPLRPGKYVHEVEQKGPVSLWGNRSRLYFVVSCSLSPQKIEEVKECTLSKQITIFFSSKYDDIEEKIRKCNFYSFSFSVDI
jgi:hypothetical protein